MFSFSKLFKKDAPIESMDDALGITGGDEISKPCETCRWWTPESPMVCDAFPEGIPLVIFLGYLDHTTPFANEDLLYEKSLSSKIQKKFNIDMHPKYPAGTPKGGQFMPKGSADYNKAIAEQANLEPKKVQGDDFSAHGFHTNNSKITEDRPITVKLKQQDALAKKFLSPEHYEEFTHKANEAEDAANQKKESYRPHVTGKTEAGDRIYTPERLKAHDEILHKLFEGSNKFKPKKGEAPEFAILGGRGGAGKSHFQKTLGKVSDDTHLILDNDKIKEMMPEYDPEKPHLTHHEAGDILEKALTEAKVRGLNVALDATMRNSEAPIIDEFKKAGYKTAAHFMYMPPEGSVARALSRWLNTDSNGKDKLDSSGKPIRGRLVPPHVILGMVNNEKNFDAVKGKVDDWSFYRNDGASKASKPVLVAQKGAKG